MAVYKRTYKGYAGAITAEWQRFLVIPRFAWQGLFQQRFLTILFVLCFFYPLGCALFLYLNQNLQTLLGDLIGRRANPLTVGNQFFFIYTNVQCMLAFILTAFIGPGLISSDLANNALPLYFCRPISRTEYVAGKALVIAGLLSIITWIPGLMLFGLQAGLADGWFAENSWIAGAIVGSCVLWILVITMLALALSAWVRWRIVAGALMMVILSLGAGIAQTVKSVTQSTVGFWFDIASNSERVWMDLFRMDQAETFSVEEAVGAILFCTAICVYMLAKKVRAYEVVR
ncbi:MAG: ABC transporter permease [Bryobacterales bacterium]|nr:ABC transporter permease [Bryobacterales bacterium]